MLPHSGGEKEVRWKKKMYAGQIYQASLLLSSPVTKRTKSSVLMNLATI